MARFTLPFLCTLALVHPIFSEFLRAGGSNFYYGSNKVFLSGVNFAWNSYGYDFGNGQYGNSRATFEDWLRQVKSNGGNTVRVWLHVEADNTPLFDGNGYVTYPDRTGTLIGDMANFLDYAYDQDVFVIFVLWNGALQRNQNVQNLVWDDSKLQSYIDNALVPMVRTMKNKPSLAAWEIFNEPEGSVLIQSNPNPCFDTTKLASTGAGWANNNWPMQRIQRFINWQAAAIHSEDPKALITVGSWSEHPQTGAFGETNYYTNNCLVSAGGRANGVLDFYQMHTYTSGGRWNDNAPFKVDRWAYNVNDKPLVIGEFAEACSQGEGIEALFDYSYRRGYSGALSWHFKASGESTDTPGVQLQGLRRIRGYNDQSDGNGGLVNVDIYY